MTISVLDSDPRMAAEIANGYVAEYKRYSSTLAITDAAHRRLFFEEQMRLAKDNLTNAEEAMKDTESTSGVLQVDSQTRLLIEAVASLRAQIVSKEVQLHSMGTYATDNNPSVVETNQELNALRAQLAQLGGSSPKVNLDMIVPEGRVPDAQMVYLRHLRDVKYYETIYELLAKQFEAAKLDEARQDQSMQVVDPAEVPEKRFSSRPVIASLKAFALGLLLSFFLCLILQLRERSRRNASDVERWRELAASFRSPSKPSSPC